MYSFEELKNFVRHKRSVSNMNILFLSASFYPTRGGVQKHAYHIAKELIKKGHHITVITEISDQTSSTESVISTIDGIDVVSCPFGPRGFAKKIRIWWQMWKLRQYILQADVIHCHDVFFWYLPFSFLFPWVRVFTTFHGYEGIVPPHWQAVFVRRISNYLSQGSIHIGNYIQKWYGTQADVTLYGGVEHGLVQQHTRKRTCTIVLVGRLADDIGCTTYAQIFDTLKTLGFSYELEICGDGPMRGVMETYGTVHGMVDDVDTYLKKADIVCASSYLTIIEALSYGKQIVSVYENELKKDYLIDSPFQRWLVIGNDAKDMAQTIMRMHRNTYVLPDSDKLNHYLDGITWDKIAHIYEELWKK